MIEAILNFGEGLIWFLAAIACAVLALGALVGVFFLLRYLGRITRSQTLAAGPATNPSPTSTAGARRSWGSAISGFLGFVIKLLFALLLIGVAMALTSWFFGWLDISHLMPNTNPQPPTPQPAPATTPSGPSWWSKKENHLLLFAIFGISIFVAVSARYGSTGKRGLLSAIGALLVALPALFFGMELIDNDGDVSKTWKSIFRMDPTMQASAAQAPTRTPAVPPPATLNAGETYSIPCTLGQSFTIEFKQGAILRNNGCDIGYRVQYNRDATKNSAFSLRRNGFAPVVMTPTSAECNDQRCHGQGQLESFEATSDTATLSIIACPPGKWVAGQFACRP